MPHELTENRKQSSFEVSSYFISCNNNRQFLISIVTCDEKWILYDNWQWTAQWLDQEEAVNHFLKPNLHKGKGHGHYLVVCCQSNPLWLSESWRNNYISANQWDALKTAMPGAGIGQQNGPNSSPQKHLTTHCAINASKVEEIGLQSFASSAVFTWFLIDQLPLL